EAAYIVALGLLDELVHQDIAVEALEVVYHAFSRLVGLRQRHAAALGALQQLHDQGRAAHNADQVLGLQGRVGKAGDGDVEAAIQQRLEGEELVPGAGDGGVVVEDRKSVV